ncbi:DUF4386 domain-containing protein [Fulvivirga sp. RKSG066]|uniref:DUF4386 domain-containing protein n=1 Tax=Fulvivirga aurantia TaxID=2529383 RepID=UPI0012BC6513|nr:DUF4386 domain-containing protein [Fulvivirga aurantia]MTI23166.1 DUF4386 domain-containing protein [Fulvivirga aurantia]
MNKERKTAVVIGSLFLLSTTTFLIGDEIIAEIVYTSDYLKESYPNSNKIGLGAILQLVNDISVVSIGIMFFPILAKYSHKVALAYLGSRITEGVLLLISAVSLLSIIPLSEEYVKAAGVDEPYFETFGVLLKMARYSAFQLAMISLSIGSLFLCYLLYKYKLIPRIITIVGITGYGLLLFKMVSEILGCNLGGETLYIPGALYEIIMPLWLFFKGFNVPANVTCQPKSESPL